jgi:hypothetical protein
MYKHELVRYIHTILMMVLLLRGGENCWLPRDRIELLFFLFLCVPEWLPTNADRNPWLMMKLILCGVFVTGNIFFCMYK